MITTHSPPIDRILSKTKKHGSCLLYTGSLDHKGYGRISINYRAWKVHRWMYEHFKGTVPFHLVVDHLCNNRSCINLKHLEVKTQRENILRGTSFAAKNAKKVYCDYGHKFPNTSTKGKPRRCSPCSKLFNTRANMQNRGETGVFITDGIRTMWVGSKVVVAN